MMRKIVLSLVVCLLVGGGIAFGTDEEDNRELGIEMKGHGKPTIQEAGMKAKKKINKYNKAKKEVIDIFAPAKKKGKT